MGNSLNTEFVFDAKKGFATADAIEKRLVSLNASLNNLGKAPLATPGLDKFTNKISLADKKIANLGANISSLKSKSIEIKARVGEIRIPKSVPRSNIEITAKIGDIKIPKTAARINLDAHVKVVKYTITRPPTIDVRARISFNKIRAPKMPVLTARATVEKVKFPKPSDLSLKVKTLTIDAGRINVNGSSLNLPAAGGKSGDNESLFGAVLGGNLASRAITAVSGAALSGVGAVLDYSSKLEQATIGMTTMTGSAIDAKKHLSDLQTFAKTTPFEFGELVTASQKFQGVGIQAQKVIPILTDVGNSLAAAGRISELPFATKAIGDIVAKGRLQGQEIIQLANAGIPALKILSGALGKTQAEIIALGEDGKISSDLFLEALSRYSKANFGDAMKAQSRTFGGAMSNIKDALYITSQTAFEPLYEKISKTAVELTDRIANEKDFVKVGGMIASAIAKGVGETLSDQIKKEIKDLREGKSDAFALWNATVDVGAALKEGTTGKESVESILRKSTRLAMKGGFQADFAYDVSDLPDLEAVNFFGALNDEIIILRKIRETNLEKLRVSLKENPNALGSTIGSMISALGGVEPAVNKIPSVGEKLKLDAANTEAKKLLETLNKFNVSEVDGYLAFGKAEINAGTGSDLSKIRETADLEQAAIREKIRLQKQFYGEQAQALTREERNGSKGTELALQGVAAVNQLERQGAIAKFEAQKRINEEIDKAKTKVKEIGKTIDNTFDDLFVRLAKDNPIASVFLEGDKALKTLRENLKGLDAELQAKAISMQQKLNAGAAFEARLDNNLEEFELRQRAKDLRKSPSTSNITDPNKFFAEYIEFFSKKLEAGGAARKYNASLTADGKGFLGYSQTETSPFARFHSNIYTGADGRQYTNGFSRSDARNDILNSYDRITSKDGGFGGFSVRQKTFADLTKEDKDKYFADSQSQDNQSFNDRLKSQLSIIESRAFTPEQQAIADKKLIGLTSALNPDEIRGDLKEKIALANEREADRRANLEKEMLQLQKDQLAVDQQKAGLLSRLVEIAEKEGSGKITSLIEIVDKTDGKVTVTGAAAGNDDVRSYYEQYEDQ